MSHTLQAFAFTGISPFTTYQSDSTASRYCTGTGFCQFIAPVFLPEGSLVTLVQFEGCDQSSTTNVTVALHRSTNNPASTTQVAPPIDTGVGATPGCGLSAQIAAPPYTIDNQNETYWVLVSFSGSNELDITTRLMAVRIFYTLQVSPAPATATFNDVPTNHPFFPFIEALAAAGITGGCSTSPPLYCPDNPVTRGQMATFIARALGLHWAP